MSRMLTSLNFTTRIYTLHVDTTCMYVGLISYHYSDVASAVNFQLSYTMMYCVRISRNGVTGT